MQENKSGENDISCNQSEKSRNIFRWAKKKRRRRRRRICNMEPE
jgi:hypothetical protein